MRWLALVVIVGCGLGIAGCGRFGFGDDTSVDADIDSAPSDVPIDAGDGVVRFEMDDDPRSGTVTASPAEYSVSCAPCPTPAGGHIGGSYHFDGATRVAIGHPELITRAPFTIALWARADAATTGLQSIVSKPASLATVTNVISFGIAPDGSAFWESAQGTIVTTADLRGAWHHLAAAWDGTTRRLYVDGVVVGTDNVVADDSTLAVAIGGDLDNGAPLIFYVGDVDQLEIHPRGLDAAEIGALASQ